MLKKAHDVNEMKQNFYDCENECFRDSNVCGCIKARIFKGVFLFM